MDRIPFDPYDFFGYLASGLLVVVAMELLLGFPKVIGQELKAVDAALLIVGIYVAGQIIATPAKALLEDGFVGRILGRPSENLLLASTPLLKRLVFPGYVKPLPDTIKKKILERAAREGVTDTGERLFLHVRYLPEILTNEKLMAKLEIFVNKYGFTRNLSFTSLMIGAGLLLKACVEGDLELRKFGVTAMAVGVLLFYRYLKFFRQYSFELLNQYGGKN